MDGFDFIGDIHGHAEPLRALLRKLGYVERGGAYRHPSRRVFFLGDFIDRGPGQREVLDIVRRMMDAGSALAVMGNHEFNALAFHTEHPEQPGQHLRPRTDKNTEQHQAFLDAYAEELERSNALEWFWELPLWFELEEFRVVHASWHPPSLAWLRRRLPPELTLTRELLIESATPGSPAYEALETILKGVETPLPPGVSFTDHAGHVRHRARLKWWQNPRTTSWRKIAFLPPDTAAQLPEEPLPESLKIGYGEDEPPVFIGHYWLSGPPQPQAPNVACLDYSVARPGGKLVAYRWDGESQLETGNYVWVER